MRFVKRVLSRGALILPSDVRRSLHIREGDVLEVEILRVIRREELAEEERDEPDNGDALVRIQARAEVDAEVEP